MRFPDKMLRLLSITLWYVRTFLASICLLIFTHSTSNALDQLPSIGEQNTSTSTPEEKRLGQAWLRLYRSQVSLSSDPIIIEYTEKLLKHLAEHNPEAGDEFFLVIAKNDTLNAFAVPGGVIGVHTGLFQYAQTEDQFASVLAHELAHLSQRHYARGVEKQKGQQLVNMAAILTSLVIAASSGNGEAGLAALQASQAGLIDQQLRFSRLYEEEADRIGMTTLIKAGFDPHAVAKVFEQMQRAGQFSSEPPEFLLTHPVTAKRIADAENRARVYPDQHARANVEYDLIRSRVLFQQEETPQQAINRFQSELRGFSPSENGSRYGLTLALIANKEYKRASEILAPLLKQYPEKTALIIAQSNIEAGKKDIVQALTRIKQALEKNPKSYALHVQHFRILAANTDYINAMKILNQLSQTRPQDPFVWFHLAELAGLAGDRLKLHKARAEYFILYGNFDQAEHQLKQVMTKSSDNNEITIAKKRLEDIKALRKTSKL